MEAIVEYAARCRLPIYSRQRFVEEAFYPEAYILGTLCVGFNLPFDLTRIAIHAGTCRGEHRRKFRIVLSRRLRWHDLRIESASGRAAFINLVPKRKLFDWERPFFSGRFCDLSMAATAFSGKRHSLRSAGSAFAAYTRKMKPPDLGGRAGVRVRKRDVGVRVLDYTAMYPTIFCLQRLDKLLAAPEIKARVVTAEIKALVAQIGSCSDLLFEPRTWTKLNCLVLVDPQWAVLPVRMCENESDPYTIAVTPVNTREGRWHSLADVLAAVLLGGPAPTIRRAIRFVPSGRRRSMTVRFRDAVALRSNGPFFETIVEQRQIAKQGRNDNRDLAALEAGLKQLAAGGAYGIYAEINVQPAKGDDDLPGEVYADIVYPAKKVHDERPGAFTNPIIASLVTGGARLMLALLEREVVQRGGTFAFCDTDSLAIPCGGRSDAGIPCIPGSAIEAIVKRFDALSPYDPRIVPHLLKVEYPAYGDLRCFAISVKRYVLYRPRSGSRIEIIKASESALGAIIGRSPRETTAKLARRIWLSILMKHLPVNPKQRRRAKPLVDFNVPLRRKFPIGQPAIYQRLERYNKTRSYDFKVKPFGFVQSVALAACRGADDPLPIAPFETDLAKARRLQWVDFNSGSPVRLDWAGSAMEGTLEVMRLSGYVEAYHRHPEAKAADRHGNPVGPETTGLLGRLRVQQRGKLRRIGKEVDRLDEDEGASLVLDQPVEYERDDLADDIAYLARFPRKAVAEEIGISERRWRDTANAKTKPRDATAAQIARVANESRSSCSGLTVAKARENDAARLQPQSGASANYKNRRQNSFLISALPLSDRRHNPGDHSSFNPGGVSYQSQ